MCSFVSSSHVLPGFGCCACRTYNGLQREREGCRGCGRKACPSLALEIPKSLARCGACGFGYDASMWGRSTVDGSKKVGPNCPVCQAVISEPPKKEQSA